MNITALVVSIAALALSSYFASRQIRSMRNSDSTLVAIEMLTRECRSEEFLDSEEFVLNQLSDLYSPADGIAGLAPEHRKHVKRIGLYYSSLGLLSVFRVVDDALLISAVPSRSRRMWLTLEPFILAERSLGTPTYLSYFEHLVCLVADADVAQIQRDLGIRRIGPRAEHIRREFSAHQQRRAAPPISEPLNEVALGDGTAGERSN